MGQPTATVPAIAPPDEDAVHVASAAFAGLQRGAASGDWEDFVDLLADDVRIMVPVPSTEAGAPEGVLRGTDLARSMFDGRHREKVRAAVLEGRRLAANGPLVVVERRVEGTLDAEEVANHFVFVFEVADGQIDSMYEYAAWTAKGPQSS